VTTPLIVLVMAMEAEAAPLREAIGAQRVDGPAWAASLPPQVWHAPDGPGGTDIVLVVNGTDPGTGVDCIGTTAAALATMVAIDSARALGGRPPDLVLSVGTAGGWERSGAVIGDVYLAWDRFVCHDRRIDLPGFDELGRGDLPAADLRRHGDALGCRLGVVTTGDSLDESPDDAARILASGAEVKEMEAAAVAWVAGLHDISIGAVKAITDLVDDPAPTAEQFTANLASAAAALRATTVALLERLGNENASAH
jgi:nucleoside phosphorylase